MKLPKINLKELEKIKKENFRQRLEFQDLYVKWMKMASNEKWSSAQNAIINKTSKNSPEKKRSARQIEKTKRGF